MNTIIGTISTLLITLVLALGITNENMSEDMSSNSSIKEIENNEVIDINDFWNMQEIEYAARGEEVDLISENKFLKEIAELNDLEVSRQLKIYISEYEGQRDDEYSKFQENFITYRFKDNRDFYVELRFSKNEILGMWKENENVIFKESIIQNKKVHIFEWKTPVDNSQSYCRAQFTIDGMNFIITTYNMSHEEFVKMIKTTIEEYEKLLLKSINKGEKPETTGYIPKKFIDNNKILYTCIGWEHEKGCGIIEIDTGENVYYENGNNVRYYYDESEEKIIPMSVE